MVEIRTFSAADAGAVSQLVHQVFDEYVAPSFEPAGIAEMHEFTSAQAIAQRARKQDTYVAWRQGQIVGVIQMREIDHIALLFVRGSHMGRGIALALVARVEDSCRAAGYPALTVNSSLNAQTYYEKIGFVATSEPQEAHGFAYLPMKKVLVGTSDMEAIMLEEKGIYTQSVHAGERVELPDYVPVSTPLHFSVGYLYEDMKDLDGVFGGTRDGFVYPRYGSPTVSAFEQAIATLERAEDAVAFASGMGAIHAALMGAGVQAGTAVVAAADVYGATYALLERTFASLGVRIRFVDITDLPQVRQAVNEEQPVALLCEIISNPLMKVADIPALAEMIHAVGGNLIVDSTFATPYLFRALDHGADYAVHSATKYLGGHGDMMAGVVACSAERGHDLRERQKLLGANLGPQQAWLALRGLKTLPLRMRQHCANAQDVAEKLAQHPALIRVNYPGLPTHPQYDLAARLFGGLGFGGMLSFELGNAGQSDVFRFMEALDLVLPATTLGDVYSLTLYPAHSSHRAVAPEVRAAIGITDGLVRLSVGIEDAVDIVADLYQALDQVSREA